MVEQERGEPMIDVAIITTVHWEGDPRLNRHVRYLEESGHHTELITFAGRGRMGALLAALRAVLTSTASTVVLPDPDMFFLGSLAARLTGRRPVIDIHEDYTRAAAARSWIPDMLRPATGALARIAVALGRLAAWRVVVAAPELARRDDIVVRNIPDPDSLPFVPLGDPNRLVYIGDVTLARGALDMVEVMAGLGEAFTLTLVGRIDDVTRPELEAAMAGSGTAGQIELTGRLDHSEAWRLASGALAGLNLLRPVPAYRDAVATKLWEYLAVGTPPVVSDLPGQAHLVSRLDPQLVCRSIDDAVSVITALSRDVARRRRIAESGRRLVEEAWAKNRPDLAVQGAVAP